MTLELREGLLVAERFRLERELGRGGMGSVWLARHTGLDIACAVKFIDREGRNSAELRARFEREAKSAAQLKSPHVVQILDYGVWEECPYIAMEYLEGEDLATRLDSVWLLGPEETFRIVAQVAKALGKAHAAGIVHRDMKPENIFLVRDGEDEVAKVLDFGIAKTASMALVETGTKTGSLLGTPFYMSPEQARGVKAIDHRSDLWSLAVITYQCVTGQLPFESEGLGDVLAKIMYEPIPLPSATKPGLPPEFDEWWKRAAARQPEERFQSAKELADALAQAFGIQQPSNILSSTVDQASLTASQPQRSGSEPVLRIDTKRANAEGQGRSEFVTLAADTGSPLATTIVGLETRNRKWRTPLLLSVAFLGASSIGVWLLVGSQGAGAHASAGSSEPVALHPTVEPPAAPEPEPVELHPESQGTASDPAAPAGDSEATVKAPAHALRSGEHMPPEQRPAEVTTEPVKARPMSKPASGGRPSPTPKASKKKAVDFGI